MNKKNIDKTLKILSRELSGLNYSLIGSANLYVLGLPVEPRDIDIMTNEKTIYEIENRLKMYQDQPIYFDRTEGRNSYRGFFTINNIEVEVLGNVNNLCRPLDMLNHKNKIKFEDFEIYIMPLKEELKTYEKMERLDKVEIINKYLKNKK